MSKSVREQVTDCVAEWIAARDALRASDAEGAAMGLLFRNMPLFASAEENAREVARLRGVIEEAIGVLTEPGIMDVDQWKAWSRRTVDACRAALSQPVQGGDS